MPPHPAPRSYPGAVSEPVAAGYQPFPGFGEWAGVRLDLSTFDGFVSVLDELRSRPDAAPLTRAVEVATRAAAIDTGAIEGLYEVDRGFTMTVARGVAAWEKVIAAREPVVRRSFEDALRAYDFVLDLATSRTEVSEMAVRQIHELICAGQETCRVVTSLGWQDRPLPKGRYKDDANNPVSRLTGEVHAYAPPLDVSAEMNRLVRELRSAEFVAAHPVLQAAAGVAVGYATTALTQPAFQIAGPVSTLPVELREVFPTVTSVLRLKLGMWADSTVAGMLAEAERQVRRG